MTVAQTNMLLQGFLAEQCKRRLLADDELAFRHVVLPFSAHKLAMLKATLFSNAHC